ncbi:MAG: YbjQ family protein, partial [Cyanobacteria bacterium]|nr:YbjQ family protein [Cyanobacteriota bacterium]
EAILRMKEKALSADVILNVRVQTASIFKRIGKDENGAKAVEVMAYGTALYYPKKPQESSLEAVTSVQT